MNNKLDLLLRIILVASMQFFIATSFAQISWPTGQLLPSFPATAHTQDLIYLNGTTPLIEKSRITSYNVCYTKLLRNIIRKSKSSLLFIILKLMIIRCIT